MERGLNLNDPRLKRYIESLEPKYREMLEALYSQDPNVRQAKMRQLATARAKEKEDGR